MGIAPLCEKAPYKLSWSTVASFTTANFLKSTPVSLSPMGELGSNGILVVSIAACKVGVTENEISKAIAGADRKDLMRKLPKFVYDEEKALEVVKNLGYSLIYMKRSGQKRDGCGLFYKHDCAELLIEEKIEYNDLVKSIPDRNSSNDDDHTNIQTVHVDKQKDVEPKNGSKSNTVDRGDPNDPHVRLKRDCVGIMAAFKFKDPSRHIVIVANTHLYWDPEWADVKLAQAKCLLSRLAKFKTLVSDRYECIPEVIVAGDFNSQPGDTVVKNLGYSLIYMKRSGQKRDGCGLFYKHDCAELLIEEKIEYNDLVKSIPDRNSSNDDDHTNIQTVHVDKQKDVEPKNGSKSNTVDRGDPNDPHVRLKRDCVGIMAAFKFKDPSRHIVIVANTHLYWDPEWADVKLAQAKCLLSRLAKFKTLVSDRYECIPEVIVAGDFNSQPGDTGITYTMEVHPKDATYEIPFKNKGKITMKCQHGLKELELVGFCGASREVLRNIVVAKLLDFS
ncbi:CCR4-NOT transcription complex subunit 6 [Vigna unguiculata]|uniref:CCR4-NOT transcription complex subunit 6 n=1 Tax=Vigna unguiculata TaxID=3917 RepID=A0A4D6M158_VIGUN|nr:CCR4-NOT transcription complex subunit 6 [Vigna unguiculata]